MTKAQSAVLVGRISGEAALSGTVAGSADLVGTVCQPVGYADYDGDYEVTPKVIGQTLPTKDKHMTDDMTIKAIPYFSVGNNSGGDTVYIGSEV